MMGDVRADKGDCSIRRLQSLVIYHRNGTTRDAAVVRMSQALIWVWTKPALESIAIHDSGKTCDAADRPI